MINFSLKDTIISNFIDGVSKFCNKIFGNLMQKFNMSKENGHHFQNIAILLACYSIVSIFLYPKFNLIIFAKEIFALLCSYGAIFLWFVEKITPQTQHRIALGVTACISPIFFINNSLALAIIEIFCIIFLEFVAFEYIKGVDLFSKEIPVYIICNTKAEVEVAKTFGKKYKILELILLGENVSDKPAGVSSLSSVESIERWLKKIRRIPFFPAPRRFIYMSPKLNANLLGKFLEISSNFSIPFFKGTVNDGSLNVVPVSIHDFERISISSQEKTLLSSVMKGKRVWITYDGRGSIVDLVHAIVLSSPTTDISVLCESEKLANEINLELAMRCYNKSYSIKVMDLNLICQQSAKPDIFFYNLPVKTFDVGDDNLKEAVIKNVIDTEKFISFVQKQKIPFVFVLSSLEALNSNNWVGATQKLGELLVQFADYKSRKLQTKFKVVRLPETPTDLSGLASKIMSSILLNGYVNVDVPKSELQKMHYRKDIISPLIKLVAQSLKEYDPFHSTCSIIPQKGVTQEDVVKLLCNILCIRMDQDIKIADISHFSSFKDLACILSS